MKESQQDLQVQWLKYRRISYSYRVSCSICMASHFCSLVRILLDITQFNVLGPNWLVCDAIHWRGDTPCSHYICRISGFNTSVQLFPQLFVIEKMLQMKHRLFQSGYGWLPINYWNKFRGVGTIQGQNEPIYWLSPGIRKIKNNF